MRLDIPPSGKTTKTQPGERYGNYVLVENLGAGDWLARCDCGTEKEVRLSQLKSGRVGRCASCRDNRDTHGRDH